MTNDERPPTGRWSALWRQPRRWWMLGIPVGAVLAFVTGILFWGGLHWAVELSNTETFCISCHEMRDNVYQEYKGTIHDSNRTGVRATCSDCHVPKIWAYKMARKMQATFNELPKHVIGHIDTPEKFNAKRLEMAEKVWASMKATNSRECRNCHELAHMDLSKQDKSAAKKHTLKRQQEKGETCIDCHKGIAHTLPETTADAPAD